MGWLDIFSSRARARREAAIAAALETGLLQRCPVCREVTEPAGADAMLARTERLAHQWIAGDDNRARPFDGDADALLREIHAQRRRAPFDCLCDRL